MAFQQGLSGLNTSAKALDVVSNNIANASTVGFKAGQAQFADVYAASLGIGGASQVGIGANTSRVQQQFSQGNITTSNNPLDIAVNGAGFFRMQKSPTDQTISYTRNGQFNLDAQGFIVNGQQLNLTGYPIVNNVVNRAQLVPVQLDTSGVVPRATGASDTNPGILTQINLDDRETRSLTSPSPDNLAPWDANTSFPPNNLNTFNYSTSVTVYDQKGNDHALSMYFTRIAPSDGAAPGKNLWEVHYVLDSTDITSAVVSGTSGQLAGVPTLEFNQRGGIVTSLFSSGGFVADEPATSAGDTTLAALPDTGSLGLTWTDGVAAPVVIAPSTYSLDAATGVITFLSAPPVGGTITANYTAGGAQSEVVSPFRITLDAVPVSGTVVLKNAAGATLTEGVNYTVQAGGVVTFIGASTNTAATVSVSYQAQDDAQLTTPTNAIDYLFNIDVANSIFTDPASPFFELFENEIPVNFGNSTLFGSGYDVNKLIQDGYPYGRLSGVSVSPDGVLRGNYSNGQTKDIAQLVLVDFISPSGLSSLGNNQWGETSQSGQPLVGDPGAGNRGLLQAASVEEANVDLTQELVNLITFQRNYQANAQSIKTQDQILQTLVNLR
jgi:flagellar hook protein FlgE